MTDTFRNVQSIAQSFCRRFRPDYNTVFNTSYQLVLSVRTLVLAYLVPYLRQSLHVIEMRGCMVHFCRVERTIEALTSCAPRRGGDPSKPTELSVLDHGTDGTDGLLQCVFPTDRD